MTILERMKADLLTARKARDARTTSALVTLVAEIEGMYLGSKTPERKPDDSDAIAKIRRFVKALDGNLELALSDEAREEAMWEKALLEAYLPQQLTRIELESFVEATIEGFRLERTPKSMGVLMKELREKYEGQYDGKTASEIVKAALAR